MASSSAIQAPFSDYGIEGNVPGLGWQSVNALHFMREAEQKWAPCPLSPTYECEAAVVVAASHAQAMTVFIKTEQGNDYEIQSVRGNQTPPAWKGFRDIEAVAPQPITRPPPVESKFAAAEGV
jgi:hypothetical protein